MAYAHVLDIIRDLLSENNGRENETLLEIYTEFSMDENVKRAGIVPSLETFKKYLTCLKSGFTYACGKFGENSLPTHLMFFGTLITNNQEIHAIMAYFPEDDKIGITYLHIAKLCSLYEERCLKTEPRLKGYVTPQNMTRLQAIEECYHAYQNKILGYPHEHTLGKWETSKMELEIADVFAQAIKDLQITLYKY